MRKGFFLWLLLWEPGNCARGCDGGEVMLGQVAISKFVAQSIILYNMMNLK